MSPAYPDFTDVGPGTPAGIFLRSFWQPVFLSEKLAAGKAMPLRILGEDFTLFRGQSGKAYIIAPYCAHRGLKLSTGRIVGETVECFYHGWTYDGTGQCVAQPAEKKNFATKVKLAGYPVREHLGLIFAYLGEGEPPELPLFDVMTRDGFIETHAKPRAWSFFTQLENSVDEAHFNFAHRRSGFADAGLNFDMPELGAEETEYGILRTGKRGNVTRIGHIVMPNCMYSMAYDHAKGWSEHIAWRVPVETHSHISFIVECIHKEGADAEAYREKRKIERAHLASLEPAGDVARKVLRGELHVDDVPDRPDLVSVQDAVVLMGQPQARRREEDLLAGTDRQVVMLRSIWARELRAIENGTPRKRWSVPSDLATTTGVPDEA